MKERRESHETLKERHLRVIGEEAFSGLKHFYDKIYGLFHGGHLGGCRIVATKPKSSSLDF